VNFEVFEGNHFHVIPTIKICVCRRYFAVLQKIWN